MVSAIDSFLKDRVNQAGRFHVTGAPVDPIVHSDPEPQPNPETITTPTTLDITGLLAEAGGETPAPPTPHEHRRSHISTNGTPYDPTASPPQPEEYDPSNPLLALQTLLNQLRGTGHQSLGETARVCEYNHNLIAHMLAGVPYTSSLCKHCTSQSRRRPCPIHHRRTPFSSTSVSLCPHIRMILHWAPNDPVNAKCSWKLLIRDYAVGDSELEVEHEGCVVSRPGDRVGLLVERLMEDFEHRGLRGNGRRVGDEVLALLGAWEGGRVKVLERKKREVEEERVEGENTKEKKINEEKVREKKIEAEKTEEKKIEKKETEEKTIKKKKTKEQKTEEQNTEEQKIEEQKIEEQKIEEQKIEEQKTEEQKVEEKKIEEQKIEDQMIEEQKTEEQKNEEQKIEEKKIEDQKIEDQKIEDQKIEDQKIEDQKIEDQKTEEQKPKEIEEGEAMDGAEEVASLFEEKTGSTTKEAETDSIDIASVPVESIEPAEDIEVEVQIKEATESTTTDNPTPISAPVDNIEHAGDVTPASSTPSNASSTPALTPPYSPPSTRSPSTGDTPEPTTPQTPSSTISTSTQKRKRSPSVTTQSPTPTTTNKKRRVHFTPSLPETDIPRPRLRSLPMIVTSSDEDEDDTEGEEKEAVQDIMSSVLEDVVKDVGGFGGLKGLGGLGLGLGLGLEDLVDYGDGSGEEGDEEDEEE